MVQQVPVDSSAELVLNNDAGAIEILADLAYRQLGIVNVIYMGLQQPGGAWILVDAGLVGTAQAIVRGAEQRFGKGARPSAIILTHGHFDHVGALHELLDEWDVPVYAHSSELPYLSGRESYPDPDPTVGGGMMSALSRFFPRGPIDVSKWVAPLPADGQVPYAPDWRWVHTPGHTLGHISLWREFDRTLIAGDAFITTAQESAYAVMTQRAELHGPPMYYTPDWESAHVSVVRLAELEPETVITGHGPPLQGESMRKSLTKLAKEFDHVAVPTSGTYVTRPGSPK